MKTRAICDYCNKPIKESEKIYYRKHHNDEEQFCSRKCIEEYVCENLDIRTE